MPASSSSSKVMPPETPLEVDVELLDDVAVESERFEEGTRQSSETRRKSPVAETGQASAAEKSKAVDTLIGVPAPPFEGGDLDATKRMPPKSEVVQTALAEEKAARVRATPAPPIASVSERPSQPAMPAVRPSSQPAMPAVRTSSQANMPAVRTSSQANMPAVRISDAPEPPVDAKAVPPPRPSVPANPSFGPPPRPSSNPAQGPSSERESPSWSGPIGALYQGDRPSIRQRLSLPNITAADRAELSGGPPAAARKAGEEYLPGDVIAGNYQLVSVIGRGGMGDVWLAKDLTLDIDIAIKLIRRDKSAPNAAERLLREARAAARLKHLSIVRVFSFGETEAGDPFIAMELLHGETMNTVLARKGRLPPATALQTLFPVAAALVEAHSKGVVHRDLKPDNIFLVPGEASELLPKVVDFGIVKLAHVEIDNALTMAGEVVGSPDYMSPEQARGDEDVGEGTDIWAFCVVLYEFITGRRPFSGNNYNALIASILTQQPVPIMEHGVAEPALWAIIQRGLSKDVRDRYPSLKALAQALAAWAVEHGVDEDVTGASIARQWLMGKTKRLITVIPEREISGLTPSPAAAANAPAPSVPAPHSVLPYEIQPGARLSRRMVVPLTVFAAAAIATVIAVFAWDSSSASTGRPPSLQSVVPRIASLIPRGAPEAAPADTNASSAPSASSSAKAPLLPLGKSARPKSSAPAPKVPKHINF